MPRQVWTQAFAEILLLAAVFAAIVQINLPKRVYRASLVTAIVGLTCAVAAWVGLDPGMQSGIDSLRISADRIEFGEANNEYTSMGIGEVTAISSFEGLTPSPGAHIAKLLYADTFKDEAGRFRSGQEVAKQIIKWKASYRSPPETEAKQSVPPKTPLGPDGQPLPEAVQGLVAGGLKL